LRSGFIHPDGKRVYINHYDAAGDTDDVLQFNIISYNTTQGYYITTSDTNQIPMSTFQTITSLSISNTILANTNIKCLVSFDGRTNWKRWNGSAWIDAGVTDINSYDFSSANTITEIETGMAGYSVVEADTYLNFAFELITTDQKYAPTIDQITLNYNELGTYKYSTIGIEYDVINSGTTQTQVTKLSSGTENIKVNILI